MVDTIDLKSIKQKSLVWVRLPPLVRWNNGGVAQLARASALHAEGHRFDSCHLHIVMIRKRMTEQTLRMKWKLGHARTQTVQTLQPY